MFSHLEGDKECYLSEIVVVFECEYFTFIVGNLAQIDFSL